MSIKFSREANLLQISSLVGLSWVVSQYSSKDRPHVVKFLFSIFDEKDNTDRVIDDIRIPVPISVDPNINFKQGLSLEQFAISFPCISEQ